MKTAAEAFIKGDGDKTLLSAYDCKKKNDNVEPHLDRYLNSVLSEGPDFFQQHIENMYATDDRNHEYLEDVKGYSRSDALAVDVTNILQKINIYMLRAEEVDEIKMDLEGKWRALVNFKPTQDDPYSNLEDVPFENIYYIIIKNDAKINLVRKQAVVDMHNQSVVKYSFINDMVMDLHPYLMYLLQMDPWASITFMRDSFNGKMYRAGLFNLAYYIVAHYVANTPKYKNNPSIFYKLDYDVKTPLMIDALKNKKCDLDNLLTTGYKWLNKDEQREQRPGIDEFIKYLKETDK